MRFVVDVSDIFLFHDLIFELSLAISRHEGPVWQVAWAHPSFGPILASCSYDGKVIIWKDTGSGNQSNAAASGAGGYRSQQYGSAVGGGNEWTKIKEHALHSASGECSNIKRQITER